MVDGKDVWGCMTISELRIDLYGLERMGDGGCG